ncbi:tryptophanase [Streptomyces alfalfae]|uniref:tryptophanase n=1 Tax=Streptomyces alfalfae TaxID=1642299 RepID=UPI001BAC31B8|nr:tryptophanase [Streptomyces alfalfae]QUI36157.1 tryptophanase [Streptomyces alfalfae]
MEPYRIKAVEALPFTDREHRERSLREAGYNLFRVSAEDVTIDLLTDSGTGSMSAGQWAALTEGDEAYAGAKSYRAFEDRVRDLTGHRHILPVHQGRAGERVLFQAMELRGKVSFSNGHYDTTAANVVLAGGRPVDTRTTKARDFHSPYPFKGNLDLDALRARLLGRSGGEEVALVLLTLTDNGGGGHPVALSHAREVADLCRSRGVPLFLDAARYAENAYLNLLRGEAPQSSPEEIAREFFRTADGALCSLRKDTFGNMGGFLSIDDDALAERCQELVVATEGFATYGGMAGRDLASLTRGIIEATEPRYLAHRYSAAEAFARALADEGLPVMRPTACHAVYIDAGAVMRHIPAREFPAVAFANELFLAAGVRSAEMGSLEAGTYASSGEPAAQRELLRLALPRRVYTQSHLAYVAEAVGRVSSHAERLTGYEVLHQPRHLRHFTATLCPLDASESKRR